MYDPVDEDAGRVNLVGIEFAGLDEVLDFRDGDLAAGSSVGIEVARCAAVDEIALGVGFPCLYEREIGLDSAFEDVGFAVEVLVFFAFCNDSADAGPGVETGYSGSACAQALGEGALGAEFDFDFAGEKLALEFGVFTDVAGDHLLNLPRGEEKAESGSIDTGVVAGDGEIANAGVAKGEDQFFGDAAEAEAADGQEHAVTHDTVESGFRVWVDLVHKSLQFVER